MADARLLHSLFLQHPVVSTDTRKITKGCLFFALRGPNFNGNAFAEQALNDGASFAIIDDPEYLTDDRCLLVDNVLHNLQQLAAFHRRYLGLPVIAIVGSNGKTTTKELITSVLSQHYKTLSTPGNFNNHIGLPLTLLMLDKTHQMAIIEMGANHVGENAALCEIAQPNAGLITNNGKDHLEGFGSLEGVAMSNSELYAWLLGHDGLAFVNANDEWLMRMASRLKNKLTYAGHCNATTIGADTEITQAEVRPVIRFQLGEGTVESVLSGEYNLDNIMAAVCIGKHYGLTDNQIAAGINSYVPSNNRSQVIRKKENTIYLDAYNANPSSMELSLRNFAAMPFSNKVAILGDMFEMGDYAAAEHANMIRIAASLPLDDVIFVGEEFSRQAEHGIHACKDTADAIALIQSRNYSGKNIFLKGSRGMKLESIVEVIR